MARTDGETRENLYKEERQESQEGVRGQKGWKGQKGQTQSWGWGVKGSQTRSGLLVQFSVKICPVGVNVLFETQQPI